jgi:broad-specificity NMP kinase
MTTQYTMRSQPNIIVTGTPGVGKTTHCETLAQNTGLKHLSINDIVKERGCHDGYDDEFKSWIVDEDKVSILRSLKNRSDNVAAFGFNRR